ncbi:MAG: DUF1187 family protein [Phocaeicola sp.]
MNCSRGQLAKRECNRFLLKKREAQCYRLQEVTLSLFLCGIVQLRIGRNS